MMSTGNWHVYLDRAFANGRRRRGDSSSSRARVKCGTGPPFVLAAPVRGLLEPIVERLGVSTVAALAGTSERSLFRFMYGGQKVVTVSFVDLLFTHALDDAGIWHTHAAELGYVTHRGLPI